MNRAENYISKAYTSRHVRIKYRCSNEYFCLVTYGANKIPRVDIPRCCLAFAINGMFKEGRVNEFKRCRNRRLKFSLSFADERKCKSYLVKVTFLNGTKYLSRKLEKIKKKFVV